jgi:hypothetical protein
LFSAVCHCVTCIYLFDCYSMYMLFANKEFIHSTSCLGSCHVTFHSSLTVQSYEGRSWSYGSWIYNYLCNQCLSPLKLCIRTSSWWGELDTTCDKVCQWLGTGWWFSPVSCTNKTDHHHITEILLKVALNTINPNPSNHMQDS